MANRAGARELRVVVEYDPRFGPVDVCWAKGRRGVAGSRTGRRVRCRRFEYEPGKCVIW
ncbi:acetate--CoA ligase family protein [Klebsiella pneumoniae subsp. pneumoniae]|nr:acetate--CoA ligase family protein [Klebsiella pneumoniae subsp. pneumoniae]